MKNKKAVSLMVSYVILISIVIAVSIGVYAYLKAFVGDVEPAIDCKEETSFIIESYTCSIGNLELTLRNNGRFNIDGVVLGVGEDSQRAPTTYLIPQVSGGVLEGHYQFQEKLKPGQTKTADFTNKEYIGNTEQEISYTNIQAVQIQPYIIENNKRINCQQAVITQLITDCQIKL